MKKNLILLGILFLVGFLIFYFLNIKLLETIQIEKDLNLSANLNNDLLKENLPKENSENFENLDLEINLLFVGDIMLNRGVKNKVYKLAQGDYSFVFQKINSYLNSFDRVFGNLEGPISDKGFDLGNKYSFRMEPKVLGVLKQNNFKGLFLSNNHIGDWGKEALLDTVLRLKEKDILAIGAGPNKEEAYGPKYFEIKNTKISILSFADFIWQYENSNIKENIALAYKEEIKQRIEEAKQNSDLVIVHFHFGEEYQKEPTTRQKDLVYLAVDSGADLVLGTHPHVVSYLEKYKQSYIAYSLGNFIFDQYFSDETMTAGLLEVKIQNKKIQNINLKQAKINWSFQPEIIFE